VSGNKAAARTDKARRQALPYFSAQTSLGVTIIGFYMLFGRA